MCHLHVGSHITEEELEQFFLKGLHFVFVNFIDMLNVVTKKLSCKWHHTWGNNNAIEACRYNTVKNNLHIYNMVKSCATPDIFFNYMSDIIIVLKKFCS